MDSRFAAVGIALLSAAGCRADRVSAPAPSASTAADWFTERAEASGLRFVHFNGMSGEFYYPEMFGPGVGLVDIDNDGDLDVYVTQGQLLRKGQTPADALYPPQGPLRDRLFRNDLTIGSDGKPVLKFTDVTESSGIDVRSYGMGVAAGDFDNDGWVDLYRTGLSGGTLIRNNGDRTFSDVTARSGAGNPGAWSVSASFVDYDRDGWLDLYVANYVHYRVEDDVDCLSVTGQPDYCPPRKYAPQRDRLYRNRGNGTFEDVTARALVGAADGPGLGVSTADFDGDGWIDIYVGNDGEPNQLWTNQRNGTLNDTAFVSGAAVNGAGRPEASMGVDAGDYDNDGDEDLFVANWASEMNILYENVGGRFEDRKSVSGVGPPSVAKTGFATAWFDYDNDGLLDLLTVNGGVAAIEAQRGRDPFPFRMSNQLYRNSGSGRFEDVSARAGAPFTTQQVGRGAAFGDIDNDGDTDVVIGNDAGPLQLLINGIGNHNHWVGLRLIGGERPEGGPDHRRDSLGARVAIVRKDGSTLWRRVRADGSYASANDPRVLAGLGAASERPRVRVQWPDGSTEEWADVSIDRWTTLHRGSSK
jgi:enediyne biosynthesis protein E4